MKFIQKPSVIYFSGAVFLFILLYPIWGFHYFPTVDGPAHLYNSRIIRELLIGDHSFYSKFFHFNPQPVPNWSGHVIAIISGIFLPVWMVEKLLLLLIVVGIPLGILSLLKSLDIPVSWQVLLYLPFTYSLPLYLGFFNFLIAIPVLLFSVSMMIKWKEKKSAAQWLIMCTLITLIYFSHLFVFVLGGIIVVFHILWVNRRQEFVNYLSVTNFQKLVCFIPGLVMAAWFFAGRSMAGFKGTTTRLSNDMLWNWFVDGAPLVGLNGEKESPFTSWYIISITMLFLFIIIKRFIQKTGWQAADFLIFVSFFMLLLYVSIPDGIASGGFISIRLLLFFLLFLVLWIMAQDLPLSIAIASGFLGIVISFGTLGYRAEVAAELDSNANDMIMISHKIDNRSVILPLNYSGNWLHTNLSNYLGAVCNVVVLDNYETKFDEFPLKWNRGVSPEDYAGNFAQSLNPFITIDRYEKQTGVKIDYISRWYYVEGNTDSVSVLTSEAIKKQFALHSQGQNAELFKRLRRY